MKKHLLPILFIIGIWLIVSCTNIVPGTWLTGWDNLHPEFNFPLNITRSLFAVWQEYQGTGVLGGLGHASALLREITLLIFSLFLPVNLLRYVWTFGTVLIGMLGAYVLSFTVIRSVYHERDNLPTFAALVASIFYLGNLGTIQAFFTPYEAFSMHYAALPWLLWSIMILLERPSKKTLLLLTGISLASSIQWYIPTLFVVFLLVVSLLFFASLLLHRTKKMLVSVVCAMAILISTNAFWLLPFAYYGATVSIINVNAKINQMATEDIYLRNVKYGTIADTLLLKGFWFDNFEYNPPKGSFEVMMQAWSDHLDTPIVEVAGWILIGLILFGTIAALRKKNTVVWSLLSLLCFSMIAIDTPPFAQFFEFLRQHVPLLSQFFRFPFTKWSIALSLSYSMVMGIGVFSVLTVLRHKSILSRIVIIVFSALPLVWIFPVFQGKLISDRVRIAIPDTYFELFDYFKIKPIGRIAVLPQPNFWDWKYYRWGNLGSGFLWYGIEQPILDRAFDLWDNNNENYYWELSQALFAKNPKEIQSVLDKYDVEYILLDNDVLTTSHSRALFTQETESLLPELPDFTLDATFGNILVYTRIVPRSDTFVQVTDVLPTVAPTYQWSDNDIAFQDMGMYVSGARESEGVEATYYPFRSLFTKRNAQELPYPISQNNNHITMTSPLPSGLGIQAQEPLNIFSNAGQTATPYATLTVSDADAVVSVDKTESLVYSTDDSGVLDPRAVFPCGLLSPGVATGALRYDDMMPYLELSSLAEQGCLSFGMPDLRHSQGYLAAVTYRHETGRPLLLAFINQTAKHTETETYLSRNTDWTTDYFILPSLSPDGLAYTVYLANDAKGRYKTVNDIESIRVYRFPYDELVRLSLPQHDQDISKDIKAQQLSENFTVSHPNPSYYRITIDNQSQAAKTLILNQSYHDGWQAYEVECKMQNVNCKIAEILPFLFGREIKDHVLINNWANAWLLPQQTTNDKQLTTIVVYFVPQLLQWIGFALLILTAPILMLYRRSQPDRMKE